MDRIRYWCGYRARNLGHDCAAQRYPGVNGRRSCTRLPSTLVLGAAVIAGVVFGDLIEKPLKSAAIPREAVSSQEVEKLQETARTLGEGRC